MAPWGLASPHLRPVHLPGSQILLRTVRSTVSPPLCWVLGPRSRLGALPSGPALSPRRPPTAPWFPPLPRSPPSQRRSRAATAPRPPRPPRAQRGLSPTGGMTRSYRTAAPRRPASAAAAAAPFSRTYSRKRPLSGLCVTASPRLFFRLLAVFVSPVYSKDWFSFFEV